MKCPAVRLLAFIASLALLAAAPSARAAADPAAPAPEAATAPALLAAADALVEAGALAPASSAYQRILDEHPSAPEAGEARRALKILAQARATAAHTPAAPAPVPGNSGPSAEAEEDVVLRLDPYSARTSERLRLTTWEKLDFGVTSFLYGMTVGVSYAVSLDESETNTAPVAFGALAYTIGAVAFLNFARPDRGDLPLALAITSYLPTSTLLFSNVLFPHAPSRSTALATSAAGLVALPVAILAAQNLQLDPGDTQLVRDAGFWGLTLGTLGALGFAGETMDFGGQTFHREPESPTVARFGLLGLYGGLGLGALAASVSEVSLERVRVATWGGYGGGLLGALLGATSEDGDVGLTRGAGLGALVGLVATFIATESIDGIPPEKTFVSQLPRGLAPAVLSGRTVSGDETPTFGLAGNF